MAKFIGINDTSAFDPGFTFANWQSGIQSAAESLVSIQSLLASGPTQYGNTLYWNDGSYLWIDGSYSASTYVATVKEFDLNLSSGLEVGFIGKLSVNLQTYESSPITATEIWIHTASGYGVDYRGNFNFDLDTGTVSGNLKTLYMGHDNGIPGKMDYVKLTGSVSMNSQGDVTSGMYTGIEWGTLVIDDPDHPTISGKITGLKLDAASFQSLFESGAADFDDLLVLLFHGNDTVTGTSGDDYLNADLGNDKIDGGEGNDTIVGGEGNDTIVGGAGDDHIWGDTNDAATNAGFTTCNDKISDLLGNNTVDGGSGNNTITLGSGDDHVTADNGNNKIVTDTGDDLVVAGNGNNNVSVGDGFNEVQLGTGNNKVLAGAGGNEVWIGNEAAFNTYLASGGVTKGNGNNTITTGAGDDLVSAWEGNDSTKVNGGADQVDLGSGNNKIDLGTDGAHDIVTFGWDFLAAVTEGVQCRQQLQCRRLALVQPGRPRPDDPEPD